MVIKRRENALELENVDHQLKEERILKRENSPKKENILEEDVVNSDIIN